MVKRRVFTIILVTLLLFPLAGAISIGAEEVLYHTVKYGETVYGIARMYGVTPQAIIEANKLANANLIYIGQRLIIPAPAEEIAIHIVARGESLLSIAAKYGVSMWAIALRNGLANPNLIYVGQRLVIPSGGTPAPSPKPTAPAKQEAIIITSPTENADVTSPVTVKGWGSGFENSLAVDILDETGNVIGQGYVTVDAEFGQYGPFTGTIEFTKPTKAQVGRIQVYTISPRDGAIEHLASVTVNLKP